MWPIFWYFARLKPELKEKIDKITPAIIIPLCNNHPEQFEEMYKGKVDNNSILSKSLATPSAVKILFFSATSLNFACLFSCSMAEF